MQQLSVLLRGSLHMCVLAAPQRSSLAALSSPSAQRQPAAFCSLCAAAAWRRGLCASCLLSVSCITRLCLYRQGCQEMRMIEIILVSNL
jgi:hypothetical protein